MRRNAWRHAAFRAGEDYRAEVHPLFVWRIHLGDWLPFLALYHLDLAETASARNALTGFNLMKV